jgi:hypothetical protein
MSIKEELHEVVAEAAVGHFGGISSAEILQRLPDLFSGMAMAADYLGKEDGRVTPSQLIEAIHSVADRLGFDLTRT